MSSCPAPMMSGGFPCICNFKKNKQTRRGDVGGNGGRGRGHKSHGKAQGETGSPAAPAARAPAAQGEPPRGSASPGATPGNGLSCRRRCSPGRSRWLRPPGSHVSPFTCPLRLAADSPGERERSLHKLASLGSGWWWW